MALKAISATTISSSPVISSTVQKTSFLLHLAPISRRAAAAAAIKLTNLSFPRRTNKRVLTPCASTNSSIDSSAIAQGPDNDIPNPGQEYAQFGAGCFWGVELTFQRVPGVSTTEVGYTQGHLHNPSYEDICTGTTNHSEVVRVQFDPKQCGYETLLDVFWAGHDPTTMNRQGNDAGTQYRSGIYYYTPEQEKAALESKDRQEKLINRKIVTEILPAKKFYRAEEYHQQYLAKGGRFGFKQSAEKGCTDPIRCYG